MCFEKFRHHWHSVEHPTGRDGNCGDYTLEMFEKLNRAIARKNGAIDPTTLLVKHPIRDGAFLMAAPDVTAFHRILQRLQKFRSEIQNGHVVDPMDLIFLGVKPETALAAVKSMTKQRKLVVVVETKDLEYCCRCGSVNLHVERQIQKVA